MSSDKAIRCLFVYDGDIYSKRRYKLSIIKIEMWTNTHRNKYLEMVYANPHLRHYSYIHYYYAITVRNGVLDLVPDCVMRELWNKIMEWNLSTLH